MQIDLERFKDVFFQEAEEHLATLEATLLALENTPDDSDLLNALFRAAHSIKGSGATFGYDAVAKFTHTMESLLDRMRGGAVPASRERLEVVLESVDMLRELLAAARNNTEPQRDPAHLIEMLTLAQRAGDFDPKGKHELRRDESKPKATIWFRPSPGLLRQGMEPALVLRELARLGEILKIETDLSQLPDLAHMDPDLSYLAWRITLATEASKQDLLDVFAFVEEGAELSVDVEARSVRHAETPVAAGQLAEVHARASARDTTIRVATNKVDKLIDLVGELVIAQSMAAEILGGFSMARLPELQSAFADIERHTRELQERVMGIRMLPIGTVFSRLPRLVHDLAVNTHKSISLELAGEETELDKGVVESISDPLVHLVRNAADHGIESPEERVALGKPEAGVVHVKAYHQGGSVVVEVRDDGRGLDLSRIGQKASSVGLIRAGEDLTDAQTRALIFEPGFSTAEIVTDISGRGVGMDVVKKNVEALNGAISVESEPGRGTEVRIKLPLTMAILDGLLMRVGPEIYILPLIAIMESIRPSRQQVSVVAGQGEVVVLRGEPVPLIRLHELFKVPAGVTDPSAGLTVIVEHQGTRLALLVDELLGQQQVVVKTLETHFRKVDGVVGATILGDGRAALILDVSGIAQLSKTGCGVYAGA